MNEDTHKCNECGEEWTPRNEDELDCPQCGSYDSKANIKDRK